MDPWDSLFPRDLRGRITLGLASLFLTPFSGLMLFLLVFRARKPQALVDRVLLLVVEEFLLGLLIFFLAGFIWACWMPRWLERVRSVLARKLAWATLIFLIPAAGFAFWALLLL